MKLLSLANSVLLIEPDPLVSVDLNDALENAGYAVAGPFRTTAAAEAWLVHEEPAVAVLGLDEAPATRLAQILRERRVPFLVHTERDRGESHFGAFADVPWLRKPAWTRDVVDTVSRLAREKGARRIMTDCKSDAADNPFLRKLEGFESLPDADRALLLQVSRNPQTVVAGTDLIREGDPPAGVFLILEGFACRYKLRASGARQIMAYLVPGDACDLDVALLKAMDHSISTLSACKVVRIAPETVRELLQRPAIAAALRKSVLVEEATLREWLVNVGCRQSIEKIAHLFCEVHLRLRTVGRADENRFELPLTQQELADTTGMPPVHVNRSLRELRARGLIELRERHLTILDLPRLRQLAEFKSGYLHLGEQRAA